MNVAITGAAGYVGSRLARAFAIRGWGVVELGRRPSSPRARWSRWALGEPLDPAALTGVDVLIHAAYDFRPSREDEIRRVNLDGSRALFDAAQKAGMRRIVLISSISAFDGCASIYGKTKLAIEAETLRRGGAVLRPGLVYGDAPGGMVGTLNKVARLPVIPVVGKNQTMHLCHEDDLAEAAFRIASREVRPTAPVIAASSNGVSFGEILRRLAKGPRLLIPVWWRLAWIGLRTAEALGVGLGLRSDSLIGLMKPDSSPDFATPARLGFKFRSFR